MSKQTDLKLTAYSFIKDKIINASSNTYMIQTLIDINISEAEKRLIEPLSNAHMNVLNLNK